MKKLTAEDLLKLEFGDTVYKLTPSNFGFNIQPYRYASRMPGSPERYLIFSHGEQLTHLYIHTDGTFKGEWYSGKFDPEFVDNLEIEMLEKRLETLKAYRDE